MPKIDGKFTRWMLGGLVLDLFKFILRALGSLIGGGIAAGVIGAIGGGAVALIYGFPVIPWMIGGFVVCAIFAIVLMLFIAHDL